MGAVLGGVDRFFWGAGAAAVEDRVDRDVQSGMVRTVSRDGVVGGLQDWAQAGSGRSRLRPRHGMDPRVRAASLRSWLRPGMTKVGLAFAETGVSAVSAKGRGEHGRIREVGGWSGITRALRGGPER